MLTGKQLRQYLAYMVHGRKSEAPRKPPAKARQSARRGPVRDPKYLAWIRTLPSIVSGRTPCDACHTGTDGGMSMKASDYSCVPMTRAEHEEYHRIGREAFARRYGLDFAGIAARLRAEWESGARRRA